MVIFFMTFIREEHFYSLLVWIRFEGHLLLESGFTYFYTVRADLRILIALSITVENKDVSPAKILHIELNPSDKSLI